MIYLVRHAHADYSPDETRPLSPSGGAAAARLAETLSDRPIARIVSSPYRRAVQTVQPLAVRLGIDVEIDDDLRERRLANGPLDDFLVRLEATWQDIDLAYAGGESSREAQARVSRAIRRIAEARSEGHVVIASHGNALALFLQTLDPTVDFDFWKQMTLPDVYAVETSNHERWAFSRLWQRV